MHVPYPTPSSRVCSSNHYRMHFSALNVQSKGFEIEMKCHESKSERERGRESEKESDIRWWCGGLHVPLKVSHGYSINIYILS